MPDIDKAQVVFTPSAWVKMWALVDAFNSEVAWNATCRRDPDNDRRFVVDDILVHKQVVTGGTVRTDPAEYDDWLNEFDDETFNAIRLHGHSHYYCGAFASGLDTELQEDITSQLTGDMFYIFMIVNRRRDIWIKVCDKKDGLARWGNMVDISVDLPECNLDAFINNARTLVEKKPIAHTYNHKTNEEEETDGPG